MKPSGSMAWDEWYAEDHHYSEEENEQAEIEDSDKWDEWQRELGDLK